MATDEARLLVRIEAQMRQFERQMAKATGTSERTARGIERRFRTMEGRLGVVGAGFARSLLAPLAALVSARELGQAVDAFTRIENALRVAGLEGRELTVVFDQLFAAAQKYGAPLEALVDVYRAGALAQKELNVTSAELIRFTEGISAALRVSGRSAGESRGALIQLAQAIGSGIVRAEEFNAILEGALPIAQATARGLKEAGGSVAKLRTLIIDGKVSSEAFFRAFEAGQGRLEALAETTDLTLGQSFTRLQNQLIKSVGKLNDTLGAADALKSVMADLGSVVGFVAERLTALAKVDLGPLEDAANVLGTILEFSDRMDRFAGGLLRGDFIGAEQEGSVGRQNFQRFMDQTEAEAAATDVLREKLTQLNATKADVDELIAGPAENADKVVTDTEAIAARINQAFGAIGGEVKPVSLEDFDKPSDDDKGSKTKTPAQKFGDDIRRIQERTAALQIEAQLLGETTLVRERALAVLDLENEAKQAGLTITPQLNAQIQAEAEAYAKAADAMEKAEEKQASLNELQQAFGQLGISSVQGLIDGTKTLNDVLDDTLKLLTDMALKAIFLGEGPLANLFGGGGGGIGASLPSTKFGGLYASGGNLGAGKWGIAGERGPEIIHGPAGVTPMGAANINMKVVNAYGPEADVSARQSGPNGREIEVFVDRRVEEKIGQMSGQKAGRAVGLRRAMVQR